MGFLAQKEVKQPEQTKELLNIRKFMTEKGDNFIYNLMCRRYDEIEYEDWQEYADAYKKYFSKMGETVVLEKDKRNKRKGQFQFIIKIQLNDTQYYDIVIKKSSFTKYLRIGNYKQDII